MISSTEIKSLALGFGADRCGIANVERFTGAPEGFHPEDIYSKCKSVVVFLKRMPAEAINAENPVVYSHSAHMLYDLLDRIGIKLCLPSQLHVVPRCVPGSCTGRRDGKSETMQGAILYSSFQRLGHLCLCKMPADMLVQKRQNS
jgi:hypothetical protein